MITKQTLIPSLSQIRNQIFRGRKPPGVRVSKRGESPEHACREFERDFAPLLVKERGIQGVR